MRTSTPGGVAFKTAWVLILTLVVTDVIGVVACTLFDILPSRSDSAALPYAIWFVLGAFAGFIAFFSAVGMDEAGGATAQTKRAGLIAVATSAAILLALGLFFYRIYWSQSVAGDYYVPDSASHTITFFVAVFGAMLIGKGAARPSPPTTQP
jgi:hypothetical protein